MEASKASSSLEFLSKIWNQSSHAGIFHPTDPIYFFYTCFYCSLKLKSLMTSSISLSPNFYSYVVSYSKNLPLLTSAFLDQTIPWSSNSILFISWTLNGCYEKKWIERTLNPHLNQSKYTFSNFYIWFPISKFFSGLKKKVRNLLIWVRLFPYICLIFLNYKLTSN